MEYGFLWGMRATASSGMWEGSAVWLVAQALASLSAAGVLVLVYASCSSDFTESTPRLEDAASLMWGTETEEQLQRKYNL